jgi:hypothetical protein
MENFRRQIKENIDNRSPYSPECLESRDEVLSLYAQFRIQSVRFI